ncbi:MAG: hypothetical protein WCI95_01175 [bacterium]
MAHAALHFAAGMTAGMVLLAPRLRSAWQQRTHIYDAVKWWILASWGLGFTAIVPSLLRYAGLPESFCSGWWMNLFLLHPLLNRFLPQNLILASFVFGGLIALQYGVILAAILKIKKHCSPGGNVS